MRRLKVFFLLVTVLLIGGYIYYAFCLHNIPYDLENYLSAGKHLKYNIYKKDLKKAQNHDTSALRHLLSYNEFSGDPGNEHGWILFKLLDKYGDQQFSKTVMTLDSTQRTYVEMYIEDGLEHFSPKPIDSLSKSYPVSFQILKIRCCP